MSGTRQTLDRHGGGITEHLGVRAGFREGLDPAEDDEDVMAQSSGIRAGIDVPGALRLLDAAGDGVCDLLERLP